MGPPNAIPELFTIETNFPLAPNSDSTNLTASDIADSSLTSNINGMKFSPKVVCKLSASFCFRTLPKTLYPE